MVKHHFYRVVCLIRQRLADDNVNGGGADKGLYGVVVVEADQLNVLIPPHPHQTPGNGLGFIGDIIDAADIRMLFHQLLTDQLGAFLVGNGVPQAENTVAAAALEIVHKAVVPLLDPQVVLQKVTGGDGDVAALRQHLGHHLRRQTAALGIVDAHEHPVFFLHVAAEIDDIAVKLPQLFDLRLQHLGVAGHDDEGPDAALQHPLDIRDLLLRLQNVGDGGHDL